MHRFSTAVPKLLALSGLRLVGLLDVLHSTSAVPDRRVPCQAGTFIASLREPMHNPG